MKHIPNILTIIRFVLTAVLIAVLIKLDGLQGRERTEALDMAILLFIVCGLTDIADGVLARKFGWETKFGRLADPLADKLLICGTFICFAVIRIPAFDIFPQNLADIIRWSTALIISAREAFVTFYRHWAESRGIVYKAITAGKIKMLLQVIAAVGIMLTEAHIRTAWAQYTILCIIAAALLFTVISVLSAKKRANAKPAELALSKSD